MPRSRLCFLPQDRYYCLFQKPARRGRMAKLDLGVNNELYTRRHPRSLNEFPRAFFSSECEYEIENRLFQIRQWLFEECLFALVIFFRTIISFSLPKILEIGEEQEQYQ